jgi:hypothetical protein
VFGSCGCYLFWFSVSTRLGAGYICICSGLVRFHLCESCVP